MAQALDDLLEKQDWGTVFARLTEYARRRLGRKGCLQQAEDLAGEAIKQLLDPGYKAWDPAACSLLWHLQSVVNGILSNQRRTKSLVGKDLRDFSRETSDRRFQSYDRTEERIEAAETLDAVFETATRAKDELCQQILMEALDGMVEPGVVAKKLGVPSSVVYEGRRRLGKYLEDVLEKEDE